LVYYRKLALDLLVFNLHLGFLEINLPHKSRGDSNYDEGLRKSIYFWGGGAVELLDARGEILA
jgi:hypothetical protein